MKKPFLLFEILVALSLMGMLITFLFSFLMQSMKVEKKIETVRHLMMERQHLHIRLQDLFTSLYSTGSDCSFSSFYDAKEKRRGISFYFDHGVDPDPAFGGFLEGKVFLDEGGCLSLVYGPIPLDLRGVWRKEILCSRASDVSFQFLASEDLLDVAKPLRAQYRWATEWSKEALSIPSIVRMVMTREEETLCFAFRLPESKPIPTWREM